MKKITQYISVIIFSGLLFSCVDEDELIEKRVSSTEADIDSALLFNAGSVDFSNYVAVGNSLTAGFMDGALYKNGQLYSMPNILAGLFEQVDGGEFIQPIIETENGFNNAFSDVANGVIRGRTILDLSLASPAPVPTEGDFATLTQAFTGDKLNNFGVPGLKAVQIASPALAANPYYARIASAPGSSSYLQDVAAARGTFYSVWLGSNDVLSYALSGATGADGNEDPTKDALDNTLISERNFQASYDAVVTTLFSNNEKGVLVTLPPVTFIPFFRAIGYNRIVFGEEDQGTIALLNANFATFNAGLDQLAQLVPVFSQEDADRRKVSYQVGANPILIEDKSLLDISMFNPALAGLGQIRPATPADLFLLSSATVLGTLENPQNPTSIIGVATPLRDQFALTPTEQETINQRIAAFNAHIQSKESANIAIFDFNAFFIQDIILKGGFQVDIYTLMPDFATQGLFSTDGIHPNARGNAIIANQIAKVIEEKWGANLPEAAPLEFPGVSLKLP